jgi:opacity protein-like surface antigen
MRLPRHIPSTVALAACLTLAGQALAAEPAAAPAKKKKKDYVLPDEFVPLEEGTWVAGFSGSIGRNDERISPRDATDLDVRTKGFRYVAGTRNGYFLARHFVVGLDFQLSVTSTTTTARTGRDTIEFRNYEERLFIGPWLRYYFPISNAWALFPEFSWGFQNRYRTEEVAAGGENEDRTSGLSFNIGFGFTYFLSRNVGFDVTGRYSRGRLRGRFTDLRANNDLSDIGLLIGFQVYLPEFTF